jgi:neutral trehalase
MTNSTAKGRLMSFSGTALVIPSIAAKSKQFYSKNMWRGPVWVNVNWLAAYGFRRYGMIDTADFIIRKTLDEIEKMYGKYGTFFEFFDDKKEVDPPLLLRKGKNIEDSYHQSFFDYGWTATLYIDMLYKNERQI